MSSYKLLSIDESGKASYEHSSEVFVLSGVVMPEKLKTKLDIQMRKLKKKFLSDEEIVFHSRDMARKKGPFAIFNDPKVETNFWSEFVSLVNNPDISLIFVVTNKSKAKALRWHPKTILIKSYLKILEDFIKQLKVGGHKGRVITESDPSQDLYLINAHNRMFSIGSGDGVIAPLEYRNSITSLSLVSKSNLDPDVQIADALAAIAGLKYSLEILKKKRRLSRAEQVKIRLINRKVEYSKNPSFFEVLTQ